MQKEDIVLELYINKINKGGALINIEGINGFIPNSHLQYTNIRSSLLNKKFCVNF